MNHPHDQLADLVDGTLEADRRAGVEAHLDTCEDCRADLAAATTGRDAARSLDPVPAPADLHERVMVAGGGGGARPRWYRWAGAAAAAAVVAAIALALPNVGSGADQSGSGGAARSVEAAQAPETDAAGGAAAVPVETQNRDYDGRALEQLAKNTTGREAPAAFAAKDGSEAVRCIERSLGVSLKGRLVRLIEARFGGTPAYIAVYLEGPGAQQAPDTSAVYVASKGDCRFLSTAAAKL
jgi:anti-sigma factor RsiW